MTESLTVYLVAGAILLAVPTLFFFIEVVASLAYQSPALPAGDRPKSAVIVLAHQAQDLIAATVSHLKSQLQAGDRVVVVADRCTDATAARAKEAGAEVLELPPTDDPGADREHALTAAREHLEGADAPEVVIVLDGDARVSEGGLDRLARRVAHEQRPVQADSLPLPPAVTPESAMPSLDLVVRNRVRPRGLSVLGGPCPLAPSGYGLPWQFLQGAPLHEGRIVDPQVLTLHCVNQDAAPIYEGEVQVSTPAAGTAEEEVTAQLQRLHPQPLSSRALWLQYMHLPSLLASGLARGKPGRFALGLDRGIPPIRPFAAMLVSASIFAAGLHALVGVGETAAWITVAAFGVLVASLLLAWVGPARPYVPLKHLFLVPKRTIGQIPAALRALRARRKGLAEAKSDRKAGPAALADGAPVDPAGPSESGPISPSGDESGSPSHGEGSAGSPSHGEGSASAEDRSDDPPAETQDPARSA